MFSNCYHDQHMTPEYDTMKIGFLDDNSNNNDIKISTEYIIETERRPFDSKIYCRRMIIAWDVLTCQFICRAYHTSIGKHAAPLSPKVLHIKPASHHENNKIHT